MNQPSPIAAQESVGLYPIRAVSQLTGVKPITLRAWENRYGLITPIRKESGHRLYSQGHIDLIVRVVSLLKRGMRIGQVKEYLDQEAATLKGSAQNTDAMTVLWHAYLQRMVSAITRFDEVELEAVYNEALSNYPVNRVTAQLITPLLEELGRRWAMGEGTIAEEHFFVFFLRNKLGARFHHRALQQQGPRLLMACLPGDRHEIGLLMLALSASEAGYCTVVLGADMPLDSLGEAAEKTLCDAIVLSGTIEPAGSLIKRELPKLVARTSVPLFFGGRSEAKALDAMERLGIKPLGADVDSGLRRLQDHIPVGLAARSQNKGNSP